VFIRYAKGKTACGQAPPKFWPAGEWFAAKPNAPHACIVSKSALHIEQNWHNYGSVVVGEAL
jgi:hypothetical protein